MPKTSGKVAQATKPKVSSAQADKKVTKKGGKGGKTVGKASSAPANLIKKKHQLAKKDNPLFEAKKRNFGIGNHVQPKRDLTRFVKWPKYIRVQRQKRILFQRLKIPGAINQFNLTADKNTTNSLFKLLSQHRPETKVQKRERLVQEAKEIVVAQKDEKKTPKKQQKKPKFVKYGLKHVTALIESRKTKLVIIANDVDPLELVLWLPTLCKKKDIPYIIVKGKAALGRIVHKKTAAVLCITEVDKQYEKDLEILVAKARDNYLDRYSEVIKKTGGQIMGAKHNAAKAKIEKAKAKEARVPKNI